MYRWWIVVVVVAVRMDLSGVNSRRTGNFCLKLHPPRSLDLDKLMGLWYAVEIVDHLELVPAKNSSTPWKDSCPVLILTRVAQDRIRMLWDEGPTVREFSFVVPIMHNPEFWIDATGVEVPLTDERSHGVHPLSGNYQSAQVMKAVDSHMVLTLCSRQEHQVMSVLMAREMKLDKIEVISVNNMLDRRGLAMTRIRETCKNGATKLARSTSLLMVASVLFAVVAARKSYCTDYDLGRQIVHKKVLKYRT